jgi:hypothetical protein
MMSGREGRPGPPQRGVYRILAVRDGPPYLSLLHANVFRIEPLNLCNRSSL